MGCGAGSQAKYQANGNAPPEKSPMQAGSSSTCPGGDQSSPSSTAAKGGDLPPPGSNGTAPEDSTTAPQCTEGGDRETAGDAGYFQDPEIQQRAAEILDAYNFFFEHIGIRKGWRTPPFPKEEVQEPFQAAAEVVAVVRYRKDEEGAGVILRQLEGSSHDFLWAWDPSRSPASSQEILEEFFRGLVDATLSDANGFVEGLDRATVDHYVSYHPLAANSVAGGAQPADRASDEAAAEPETMAATAPATLAPNDTGGCAPTAAESALALVPAESTVVAVVQKAPDDAAAPAESGVQPEAAEAAEPPETAVAPAHVSTEAAVEDDAVVNA